MMIFRVTGMIRANGLEYHIDQKEKARSAIDAIRALKAQYDSKNGRSFAADLAAERVE
jgi:hypothetical protein